MREIDPKLIRIYECDGQKLPSVTSVLQLAPEAAFIEAWKERIGVDAYVKHMDGIFARGTQIHRVCENYFLGKNHPIPTDHELQRFIKGFYTFLAIYWNRITGPYYVEQKLACIELGMAGTVDLVCRLDGKLTLIDWKTSSSSSIGGEMLEKYKMQLSAYRRIWNATHDEKIDQAMLVQLSSKKADGLGSNVICDEGELNISWRMFTPYLVYMNLRYFNRELNANLL